MKNLIRTLNCTRLCQLLLIVPTMPLLGQTGPTGGLTETRTQFEKWIELKVLASEEVENWKQEKSTLIDMIAVAEAEEAALEEKIELLEESISSGDTRRTELRENIDAAKARAETFKNGLVRHEKALARLISYLPPPLNAELQPLIQRLQKDPENSAMPISQRMQTTVGIITQVEKFQGSLSLISEVKEIGTGQSVEVKTLYIGLAQAIFADAGGRYAGIGTPASDGWTWEVLDDAAIAENIRNAIAMYENNMEPAFVQLPIIVKSLF